MTECEAQNGINLGPANEQNFGKSEFFFPRKIIKSRCFSLSFICIEEWREIYLFFNIFAAANALNYTSFTRVKRIKKYQRKTMPLNFHKFKCHQTG